MSNLSDQVSESLKTDNLIDLSADIGETLLDENLKDGILKDIPVLGIIIKTIKSVGTIQNYLFTKKLIHFFIKIKDIAPETRKKQIDKIESDATYNIKVGEKIMFIIDKMDDHQKAALVGLLFAIFLEEKITYYEFIRASKSIEITNLQDLIFFIKEFNNMTMNIDNYNLEGTGLINTTHSSHAFTIFRRGALVYKPSNIGEIIKKYLNTEF